MASAALFFALRGPAPLSRVQPDVEVVPGPLQGSSPDPVEPVQTRSSSSKSTGFDRNPSAEPSPARLAPSSALPQLADPQDFDPSAGRAPSSARPSLGQEELRGYLRQIDVELYTTSWCKYCERAREFLQSNGVPFREYDVEADPAAAGRKRSLVPDSGVPVVRIDGRVMSGFSAANYGEAIRRALERHSGVPVQLTFK